MTKSNDGEEAIYCDGCCGWIHRQCTGLSDPFFKLFTENEDVPFLCVYCMLKTQSDEIASLRSTITEMQDTITTLKRKIDCSASLDSNSDGDDSCSPNENDLATLKSSISLLESKTLDLENQLKVQSKENLASKFQILKIN